MTPSSAHIAKCRWRMIRYEASAEWSWRGKLVCFDCVHGDRAPSGPGPPHYRVYTITLRLTTLGRTPLNDWSAQRRHTQHSRQPSNTSGAIRTRNPSNRVGADPHLRRRSHWNWRKSQMPGVPGEKPVPVSTKNCTWTAMGQNPGLHAERPATDHCPGTWPGNLYGGTEKSHDKLLRTEGRLAKHISPGPLALALHCNRPEKFGTQRCLHKSS